MGATLSTEAVLTTVVLAGAVGVGYQQFTANSTGAAGSTENVVETSTSVKKSKKKKKKGPEDRGAAPPELASTSQLVVEAPGAIPGQFDASVSPPPPSNSKPKKPKKKTKQTSPDPALDPATSPPTPRSRPQKPAPLTDTDGSWTRVESRRKPGHGDEPGSVDLTTSDAGLTSSVTGNSSPVDEESSDMRTTLAEKLVPKPPKTDVDDMLPEHPPLSRVMRIQPLPSEKPAPGFSWGDYEDVHDADGEDDGWGVVKTKRQTRPKPELPLAEKAPETLTKKQRQNLKKRETQKAEKTAAEAERLATLAQHKRQLDRIHMIEQSQSGNKGKTSGGMKPVVDERGKLVWE